MPSNDLQAGPKLTDHANQTSDHLHSLLLEFVDIGKQALHYRSDRSPTADAKFKEIQRRSCCIIREASQLWATLDESDENRHLFSAAVILAAAATDDPDFEQKLLGLLNANPDI